MASSRQISGNLARWSCHTLVDRGDSTCDPCSISALSVTLQQNESSGEKPLGGSLEVSQQAFRAAGTKGLQAPAAAAPGPARQVSGLSAGGRVRTKQGRLALRFLG